MIAGPLQGVKIVDLSRYGTGRYCTMLLADYGAEVITIETPRPGTTLPLLLTDDTSPRYLTFNRNKKSMALNLRKEKGREIFYQLIKKSDVLVEGYRPGVTKKLGIDYDTLKEMNPRLIYCSIAGFGQDGPYSSRSGHDLNYVGISGILDLTGAEEGPPSFIGAQIADLIGGFCQATIAILIALLERGNSHEGQNIDLAVLDGLVHALWLQGADYLITGKIIRKGETILTGSSPGYNIYESSDQKYLTLGCYEPWFWEKLCRILDREDFLEYQDAKGEKRKEVLASFRKIFKTKTRDEWLKILTAADIPCGPVNNFAETFADPQVIHRKMVEEIDHPSLGKIKQIGPPIKYSRTPARVKNPPPRYAEHTSEILTGLGYSSEAIQGLRDNEIIE